MGVSSSSYMELEKGVLCIYSVNINECACRRVHLNERFHKKVVVCFPPYFCNIHGISANKIKRHLYFRLKCLLSPSQLQIYWCKKNCIFTLSTNCTNLVHIPGTHSYLRLHI